MDIDRAEVTEATAHVHSDREIASRPAELPRGTLIGRFTILEALGAGGMATVYSAFDAQLSRVVAIKILHDQIDTAELRARLLREAQAMARLRHPNVLTVYDVGTFGEQFFLAMEYVDGTTLRSWSREPRPWRQVLKVLKAAGHGLAAAHAAGLVHRDFKPDNVLVGKDGRVLVGDFGIAAGDSPLRSDAKESATSSSKLRASATRAVPGAGPIEVATAGPEPARSDEPKPLIDPPPDPLASPLPTDVRAAQVTASAYAEGLTKTGAVLGTLGYIAPELLFEGVTDPRCDQFAFAVTMYVTLYGRHPFARRDISEYARALRAEPMPPPPSQVPGWIHAVIRRGLAASPDRRFASMNEMLGALERDPSRRRALQALGMVAAVGCAVGATAVVRHHAALRAQCDAGEAIVLATWNDDAKHRVSGALARAGGSYGTEVAKRVESRFDEYSRAWSSVYREVSEAALLRKETSRSVWTARLDCLEGGRQRLEALIGVLGEADAPTARHALEATYDLPAPSACAAVDAKGAPASDPDVRVRLGAVERSLAQADALSQVGKDRKALTIVDDALIQARLIPHSHADDKLLLLEGACKRHLGDYAGSRDAFLDAFQSAQAAGDDVLSARAASGAANAFLALEQFQDTDRWLGIAEAVAERGGHNDAVEAELLRRRIELMNALGRPAQAIELCDRLLRLLHNLYGDQDIHHARALMTKGLVLSFAWRMDDAADQFRLGIAALERIAGADDPQLDLQYNNLGCVLSSSGHFDEARQALMHALSLERGENYGSRTAIIWASLARLEVEAKRPEALLDAVQKGLAAVEAAGPAASVVTPYLLVARGRMYAQRGDVESARADCQRALTMQEVGGHIAANSVYRSDALTCLGEAELSLGRLPAALAYLERSVALEHREDPADLPRARFALARALQAAGRDPSRVDALIRSARDAFMQMQGGERDVMAIDQWLGDKPIAVVRAESAP